MNNRFLQPPEEGLLRGGCHNKMILWNWPKKTLMLYYVLLQLTCSCYCCWPSSFLPSRVASKRAQGFSNSIDILEIIRHVCAQRQVYIWNKHVIIFLRINQRQRKFNMYSIVLFLFYNKKCISFLCCFQIISYSDSIWFSSLPTNVCYLYLSNNTLTCDAHNQIKAVNLRFWIDEWVLK